MVVYKDKIAINLFFKLIGFYFGRLISNNKNDWMKQIEICKAKLAIKQKND